MERVEMRREAVLLGIAHERVDIALIGHHHPVSELIGKNMCPRPGGIPSHLQLGSVGGK